MVTCEKCGVTGVYDPTAKPHDMDFVRWYGKDTETVYCLRCYTGGRIPRPSVPHQLQLPLRHVGVQIAHNMGDTTEPIEM